jgi:hypothetical protein
MTILLQHCDIIITIMRIFTAETQRSQRFFIKKNNITQVQIYSHNVINACSHRTNEFAPAVRNALNITNKPLCICGDMLFKMRPRKY